MYQLILTIIYKVLLLSPIYRLGIEKLYLVQGHKLTRRECKMRTEAVSLLLTTPLDSLMCFLEVLTLCQAHVGDSELNRI